MTSLLYLSQMRLPTEKAHGLQMMDIAAARRDGRPEQEAHDHARAHYGLPEGVAKVIAFVLSDEADYLRGGVRTR